MPDLHDFGGSMNNVILQASFDGRLKDDEGGVVAAGDLCTLTAGSGKDLYLVNAGCNIHLDAIDANAVGDEVVLKVNGVIVETSKSTMTGSGAGDLTHAYEFKNLFHKVTSGEILKLEVITLDTQSEAEGFIQAIEVPKGENPLEYRGE